jgi:hypothetical protein
MLTVERIKEVVTKIGEKYVIKNAYFLVFMLKVQRMRARMWIF